MKRIACLVAAVIVASSLVAGCDSDASTPKAEPECTDLTLMGARGSGEDVGDGELAGFGNVGAPLASRIAEAATGEPFDWSTSFDGVDYPAIDAGTARNDPQTFVDSVEDGVDATVDQASDTIERCPETRIVVLGMSQGALVAHDFASRLSSDPSLQVLRTRVYGVVLLGDPGRRRDDPSIDYADPSVAPGTQLLQTDGFLADPADDVGVDYPGRVLSICVEGDFVCASPPGSDWSNIEIPEVHGFGYVTDSVTELVLGWLGSLEDVN